jgi:hypothetical protein
MTFRESFVQYLNSVPVPEQFHERIMKSYSGGSHNVLDFEMMPIDVKVFNAKDDMKKAYMEILFGMKEYDLAIETERVM